MKAGFTLIELVVGLFLASLISMALYNSFFVSNRALVIADNRIAFDFRIGLIQNQLDRDFSGIFVPVQVESVATSTIKPEQKEAQESEKKSAPLEKIFYSTNAQDSFEVITFISNNPMKNYETKKQVKSKARIVRVVYRLVPSDSSPASFKLMRQEAHELDYKAYEPTASKPIRSYELADGIKSMKIEYTYPIEQEKQAPSKEQQPKTKEPSKPEYKTVKEWNVESKGSDQKQDQPQTPQFIKVTLELWDSAQKNAPTIEFEFEISTFNAHKLLMSTIRTTTQKASSTSQKPATPASVPAATPKPPEVMPQPFKITFIPPQNNQERGAFVQRLTEKLNQLKAKS